MIQSNAFESNASANADESNANASANAAVTGESNASATAACEPAFANASAFEHKPAEESHALRRAAGAVVADVVNRTPLLFGALVGRRSP